MKYYNFNMTYTWCVLFWRMFEDKTWNSCLTSKTKCHIGITLSIIHLSVCLIVMLCLCWHHLWSAKHCIISLAIALCENCISSRCLAIFEIEAETCIVHVYLMWLGSLTCIIIEVHFFSFSVGNKMQQVTTCKICEVQSPSQRLTHSVLHFIS